MSDKKFSASWPVRVVIIAVPMAVLTWLGVVSRWDHPFLVGEDLPWAWPRALFFAPIALFLRRDVVPSSISEPIAHQAETYPAIALLIASLLSAWVWWQLAKFVRRG